MPNQHFDLPAAAYAEMLREGFHPDFPAKIPQEVAEIRAHLGQTLDPNVRDLQNLLWSSIDNDTSRDLDQIEMAERVDGAICVRIGIADVSQSVAKNSAIDQHAADQTQTIYTAVRNFSMLPNELSTDMTSLNEEQGRAAVIVEFQVNPNGEIEKPSIYRALVENRAQLAYSKVGPWLEQKTDPCAKMAASAALQAQLKLQNEAALALRGQRSRSGALEFHRVEADPVVIDGKVAGIQAIERNLAMDLIEDFMIAANETMARALKAAKRSCIRRVLKSPERWSRIVDLAGQHDDTLPGEPDSAALNAFLQRQRANDPAHYPDLSLAVIKLMGPGEYVLAPGR